MYLEKSIKDIKYKFDVGFNNSSYIQKIDMIVQTMFDNFPSIEVVLTRDIGRFISPLNLLKFITTEPFVPVDYDFLDTFF